MWVRPRLTTGASYYKVGESGFYEFPVDISPDRHTVTLTITDGGLGDNDGVANGVIVDPGGVAIPVATNVGEANDNDGFFGIGSFNPLMLLALFMLSVFNHAHRRLQ